MPIKNISRRKFILTTLAGTAGLSAFPLIKSCSTPANDVIRLGIIGLGRQAMYLWNGFRDIEGVQIVAGADVYGIKRERFEKHMNDFYSEKEQNIKVETYEHYHQILNRDDIDAVVVATPDHWHGIIGVESCEAGKDIYMEKPLTFTIKEGVELVKAVRNNNRILATGSQQRSDESFRHAVEMVRNGALGNIEKAHAYVGGPPIPYDLPEEPVPEDLNWDLWLGPNPYVHYNHELNPPISLDPPRDERIWGAWRWYKEMGGGFTTDWGAHMFDIVQWALDKDDSGPLRIIPAGYQDYEYLTYIYNQGVVMTEEPFDDAMTKGVKFIGTDGWIEVSRGHYKASDPSLMPPEETEREEGVAYETGIPHLMDFIRSVRNRTDPVAPVEVGHRTATTCTLGNIAYELMRPVEWNPATESFVNDPEAEEHYHRDYRSGYSL
ncbi:MAG: Gfo/Idh/MocA family protein [bacterium]